MFKTKSLPLYNLSLLLIIFLGLILRLHNLNFPSIGYHNMKENEYLSIAEQMLVRNDFLKKYVYFLNGLEDNPLYKNDLSFPFVSYQIIISWFIWGKNLWGPRLTNILFALLSIYLMARIGLYFFHDRTLSLVCASILAILPLSVFFSRNIQPESPALFFALLASLFYLRFSISLKKQILFWAGIFWLISCLYEHNFFVVVIPVIFILPFKYIFSSKRNILFISFLFFLPCILSLFYLVYLKVKEELYLSFKPLGPSLFHRWIQNIEIIGGYINENYTFLFAFLTACGLILALFKRKGFLDRYLIGGSASMLAYAILYAEELSQNSFFQMPFVGLVCLSSTYTLSFIGEELKKIFKKGILYPLIFFILAFNLPLLLNNLGRMHSTVFIGADVAGETLKNLTQPGERIFLFSHPQGNAIARYAQRFMGWPKDLEEFKEKEKKFDIRFVCIYPVEYFGLLKKNSPQIAQYLEESYLVKEIGLVDNPPRAVYYILQRGTDETKSIKNYFAKSFSGKTTPRNIYKIGGKFVFFYSLEP